MRVILFLLFLFFFPVGSLYAQTIIGDYSVTSDCNLSIAIPDKELNEAYSTYYGTQSSSVLRFHGLYDNGIQQSGAIGFSTGTFGDFFSSVGFSVLNNKLIGSLLYTEPLYIGSGYFTIDTPDYSAYYPFTKTSETECQPYNVIEGPTGDNPTLRADGYNTRFTDLNISTPVKDEFTFDIGYFLDQNEVNINQSAFNPSLIRICYALFPAGLFPDCVSYEINELYDGATSTTIVTPNLFADKEYDLFIDFYNYSASNPFTPDHEPFDYTKIYARIDVSGGFITSVTGVEIANLYSLDVEPDFQCSLTNIGGCIVSGLYTLFIPSDDTTQNALTFLGAYDNPLLEPAFTAFATIKSASEANPSGNALSYTLNIPQANGLSVDMLSISTMTQLFGDSLPIFRAIMIVAMWLAFWAMIIREIWKRISGRDETDFEPTPNTGGGNVGINYQYPISRGSRSGGTLDLR